MKREKEKNTERRIQGPCGARSVQGHQDYQPDRAGGVILPFLLSVWEKELQERLLGLFESCAQHRHDEEKAERDRPRPERKVGQLTIEKKFLEKSANSSGSI